MSRITPDTCELNKFNHSPIIHAHYNPAMFSLLLCMNICQIAVPFPSLSCCYCFAVGLCCTHTQTHRVTQIRLAREIAKAERLSKQEPLTRSHSSRLFQSSWIHPQRASHSNLLSTSRDVISKTRESLRGHQGASSGGGGGGATSGLSLRRLAQSRRHRGSRLIGSASKEADQQSPATSERPGGGGGVESTVLSFDQLSPTMHDASPEMNLTGRESSCPSDGSQTALIDLDPVYVTPKTTRRLRSPDSHSSVEVVPALSRGKG